MFCIFNILGLYHWVYEHFSKHSHKMLYLNEDKNILLCKNNSTDLRTWC